MNTVEWALACARPEDLTELDDWLNFETTCTGRLGALQTEAREATEAAFGCPRFSRLYYGNEFCQWLVPTVDHVRRAYEAANARGLGFSLLTPYVTDAGLGRLRPLFAWLAALDDAHVEAVVNDWGVLHLLRREFPGHRLVLGRLMNRMLRDPRITRYVASPRAPASALQALRQSTVTSAGYRQFLGRMGVARVEFDNLLQGLDMNFPALTIAASLYIPYGYVATGRVCPIGSLHLTASGKFDVGSPCRRQCRLYTLRFECSALPLNDRTEEFFVQGNTHFYFQDRRMLASSAEMVDRLGISRIVYQARLPM